MGKLKPLSGEKLIAEEREKVLKRLSVEYDVQNNFDRQLSEAAKYILTSNYLEREAYRPIGFNIDSWRKMCRKSKIERLIIAGQFYLAEADRCKAMADEMAEEINELIDK